MLASLCFLKLALGVSLPAQHFPLFFLEGFDEFLALFLLFLRLFFLLVPQLLFQGLAAFATFGGVFLFPKAPTLGFDVHCVGNKHRRRANKDDFSTEHFLSKQGKATPSNQNLKMILRFAGESLSILRSFFRNFALIFFERHDIFFLD